MINLSLKQSNEYFWDILLERKVIKFFYLHAKKCIYSRDVNFVKTVFPYKSMPVDSCDSSIFPIIFYYSSTLSDCLLYLEPEESSDHIISHDQYLSSD